MRGHVTEKAPLKVGERVSALFNGGGNGTCSGPAVVHSVDRMGDQWYAVLRMVHGFEQSLVHPDFITKESELLARTREAWELHWQRLESPGWAPPKWGRSPDYAPTIEGMSWRKRSFYAYPGKVENWTTCGLDRLDKGTVFRDPDDTSKHLVFISKERPQARWDQVVEMKVLARNAVTNSVEVLQTRSNVSVLTRCDIYFDPGNENEGT